MGGGGKGRGEDGGGEVRMLVGGWRLEEDRGEGDRAGGGRCQLLALERGEGSVDR